MCPRFKDFSSSASQAKEICAISCIPFDPSKNFSLYIAVSFWGERNITILSLEKAEEFSSLLSEVPEFINSVLGKY